MNEVANTMPDLFWAYTVIWIILGVYILSLGRRLSRLERSEDNR